MARLPPCAKRSWLSMRREWRFELRDRVAEKRTGRRLWRRLNALTRRTIERLRLDATATGGAAWATVSDAGLSVRLLSLIHI